MTDELLERSEPLDRAELLKRAVAATTAVVRGVRADQYDAPTPCAGWDVRALLNHMIAGTHYFAASAAGKAPDMAVWGVDHLAGGEPARVYADGARAAVDAFAVPGAAERVATMPSGIPGPRYLDMCLMEQVLHGWDLATATGQDRGGDPVVTQATYDAWYGKVPQQVRDLGTVFGQEQPCPPDAPIADRLAAYLGRPVTAAR